MILAQCQTEVYPEKEKNLEQAQRYVQQALQGGERPDAVMFGEMFTCPYAAENFPVYAEKEDGESVQFLSEIARKYGIWLIAGSIPERDDAGKIYNTAFVFDRDGKVAAKHRKMHLFDIDVKGGQQFRESDTLTPGDQVTVFDTEFGKAGLAICFDLRFPELFRLMVQEGAECIFVPAAFNLTTGPMHWELLFRARAVDNQCFIAGTSVARDMNFSYHAYGHSIAVGPWGRVLGVLDEKPGILVTELEAQKIREAREQLPVLSARRTDIYDVVRSHGAADAHCREERR
jgi:predicted amidohydrolase